MRAWNGLPIVVFGNGGIAMETRNLINCINKHNQLNVFDFKGYISAKDTKEEDVVTCDSNFEEYAKKFDVLGVAVPHGNPKIIKKIVEKIKKIDNLVFPNLIHPSAGFEGDISLGVGNIITAGVEFTTKISLGNFNLLNLKCTVGHETVIKDYCVVNPLTAISGGVVINDCTFIGTGAKILQYRTLGGNSIIGAGAVVIKDVDADTTVIGVPAKCKKGM